MTEYPTHDDLTHWSLEELFHVMLDKHGPKKVLDVFAEVCEEEAGILRDKYGTYKGEEANAWIDVSCALDDIDVSFVDSLVRPSNE